MSSGRRTLGWAWCWRWWWWSVVSEPVFDVFPGLGDGFLEIFEIVLDLLRCLGERVVDGACCDGDVDVVGGAGFAGSLGVSVVIARFDRVQVVAGERDEEIWPMVRMGGGWWIWEFDLAALYRVMSAEEFAWWTLPRGHGWGLKGKISGFDVVGVAVAVAGV